MSTSKKSTKSKTTFYRILPIPTFDVRLCLGPEEFREILHACDYDEYPYPWLSPHADGSCHTLEKKSPPRFVVCINPTGHTEVDVASLLVHEAVHIKQHIMENLGETVPSKEFEAYCTQAVSWSLFTQYKDRL